MNITIPTDEYGKRLYAVLEIVRAYLPPDSGITANDALSEIIALVDPWPEVEHPEQTPEAWISKHGVVYPLDAKAEVHPINDLQPLYSSPPKRKWVGLTGDEVDSIYLQRPLPTRLQLIIDVQAKLRAKNA